jgi:hypothetical protein
MVQTLAIERIDQRLEHMRLANHFVERARTPLACKNLITHRNPSREESKSGANPNGAWGKLHPMRSPLMTNLQHCLQINWRKINQTGIIYSVSTTL